MSGKAREVLTSSRRAAPTGRVWRPGVDSERERSPSFSAKQSPDTGVFWNRTRDSKDSLGHGGGALIAVR